MKALQPLSAFAGALCVTSACLVLGSSASAPSFGGLTPDQEAILSRISLVALPDGQGGTVPTVRFGGVNLQIVDGSGSTEGMTGLGNLIVGYNEFGNPGGDDRTGSHNVVVGKGHSYTSYGGIVAAQRNAIRSPYACVLGGSENVASGLASVVAGGQMNEAASDYSTVTGGTANVASGLAATAMGGALNRALGDYSAVAGGFSNQASGEYASVSGGQGGDAAGPFSSVGGGKSNQATGAHATVAGGTGNTAAGVQSTVSGGAQRTAAGTNDWVAGSLVEDN